MSAPPIHAGLIARRGADGWLGVLIEGPSGSGKSDLILRCLSRGFVLVADDRVALWVCEDRLWGAAPISLNGLIEVRGLGVLSHPARPFAEIRLVAECAEAAERMPDPVFREHVGVRRPLLRVRPLEASAPEKLIHALSLLGGRP